MPTYRFYRAPTFLRTTPPRTPATLNKLALYIPSAADPAADFDDWIHDGRPVRYSLAVCEPATHLLISGDVEIRPLGPEHADLAALEAWLDGPVSGLPQAARDMLESDGISVAWVDAGTTRRQLFRYMSRVHEMTRDLTRLEDSLPKELFRRALTEPFNALTPIQRSRVLAWLQGKGIATGGIGPTTTVRQVIHHALVSNDWTVTGLGPVSF